MTPFEEKVLKVVRMIPKGKVMSYGQIAGYIGSPKSSREVGWAMHSLGGTDDFPWWRVIGGKGAITLKEDWEDSPHNQKKLLEAEGIVFITDLTIDIELYRYHPDDTTYQPALLS